MIPLAGKDISPSCLETHRLRCIGSYGRPECEDSYRDIKVLKVPRWREHFGIPILGL